MTDFEETELAARYEDLLHRFKIGLSAEEQRLVQTIERIRAKKLLVAAGYSVEKQQDPPLEILASKQGSFEEPPYAIKLTFDVLPIQGRFRVESTIQGRFRVESTIQVNQAGLDVRAYSSSLAYKLARTITTGLEEKLRPHLLFLEQHG